MTTHTYSVPAVIGGLDGRVLWDRRLQTYATVLRLFDGERQIERHYPPTFSRRGTRPLEYPTPEALVNDLVARGLSLAPGSRAAIDELACRVEDDEGPVELIGLTDELGSRRLYCLPPAGSALELLPKFRHPGHAFQWGDRSLATYDTAVAVVSFALGALAPNEQDVAAMGLVVEFLGDADADFSLSAPSVCAWFLADEPLQTLSCPGDRRSLHRRLGLGAGVWPPVEGSSAATTPTGAGRTGFGRDV